LKKVDENWDQKGILTIYIYTPNKSYKYTKGFLSFGYTPHGNHHVTHVLRLLMNTSRCLAATPTSHNCYPCYPCGKPCYGPYSVMPGGVPNTNKIRNVPRQPNSTLNTKDDNLIGPIRTRHNTHTYSVNTRQLEPQLRVPRVHPPSRATTQEMPFRATTQGMSRA